MQIFSCLHLHLEAFTKEVTQRWWRVVYKIERRVKRGGVLANGRPPNKFLFFTITVTEIRKIRVIKHV